jgi:hypothetical protein
MNRFVILVLVALFVVALIVMGVAVDRLQHP